MDDDRLIDVAHEALIRGWPQIRKWIAEDREGQKLHRRLTKQALEWQATHLAEHLYGPHSLRQTNDWLKLHGMELNEMERAFLNASQKRQDRSHRFVRLGIFALSVLTIVVVIFAISFRDRSDHWAAVSQSMQSRQLAAKASERVDKDLRLALLLGVAAYKTAATAESRALLYRALRSQPQLSRFLRQQGGPVNSLAFGGSRSQLVAFGSWDRTVVVLDAESGKTKTTLKHEGPVHSVAFSADGNLLASASDGQVLLWTETDQTSRSLKIDPNITVKGVAFDNAGRLATIDSDGDVTLWNTGSLEAEHRTSGHKGDVYSMILSADGRLLASTILNKKVIAWDTAHPNKHWSPPTKEDLIAFAFAPDGQNSAFATADNAIVLWNIETNNLSEFQRVHKAGVRGLSFSRSGEKLASVSSSGLILLWSVSEKTVAEEILTPERHVQALIFKPDGGMITGDERGNVVEWAVAQPFTVSRQFYKGSKISSVAFSGDGRWLASAESNGPVLRWDASTWKRDLQKPTEHSGVFTAVALNQDGNIVAYGDERGNVTVREVGQAERHMNDKPAAVSRLAFSADGLGLAVGYRDESDNLIFWNIGEGKKLSPPRGLDRTEILCVTIASDNQTVAFGGKNGAVNVWNISTNRITAVGQHKAEVASVAFSPDGKLLASGDFKGNLFLWDLKTRANANFVGGRPAITDVSISRDGHIVAAANRDYGSIFLWDVATRQAIVELKGHEGEVSSIAFSPTSDKLVSGGMDGQLVEWDVDEKRLIDSACRRVNRNLTADEWHVHIEDLRPYNELCPGMDTK